MRYKGDSIEERKAAVERLREFLRLKYATGTEGRCPFCKQAKGEIRKVRGGYQGVCPNRGATGPKREGYDQALLAWNGKGRG